jgi:hemerythrin superfamily protein
MGIGDFFKQLRKANDPTDNAIDLLKADHRNVESLFSEFQNVEDTKSKQQILDTLINELTVHATVEEKLVYPIIDKADHSGAGEAFQEHHVVKLLLRELKSMSPESDKTQAKVTVLCELIKHHVKEEEGDLLNELAASGTDLDELGRRIKKLKQIIKRKASQRSTVAKKGSTVAAKKLAAGHKKVTRKKAS